MRPFFDPASDSEHSATASQTTPADFNITNVVNTATVKLFVMASRLPVARLRRHDTAH